jgi:hypothetical protein
VHQVSIVFTGEDVPGSAHVGCELIDFVEPTVEHVSYQVGITKVADHKIIGFSLAEPWEFEVGASHPEALALEPLYQVVPNEAAGPTHQRSFSDRWFRGHCVYLSVWMTVS